MKSDASRCDQTNLKMLPRRKLMRIAEYGKLVNHSTISSLLYKNAHFGLLKGGRVETLSPLSLKKSGLGVDSEMCPLWALDSHLVTPLCAGWVCIRWGAPQRTWGDVIPPVPFWWVIRERKSSVVSSELALQQGLKRSLEDCSRTDNRMGIKVLREDEEIERKSGTVCFLHHQ